MMALGWLQKLREPAWKLGLHFLGGGGAGGGGKKNVSMSITQLKETVSE